MRHIQAITSESCIKALLDKGINLLSRFNSLGFSSGLEIYS